MKVTPRFMIRAALVLTAGGAIGFVGACKSDSAGPPPPPPPPPPAAPAAPSGLTATPVGASQVNLAWTDNANNETGFRVDRCSGTGCTNFAQVGTNLAPNTVTYSDLGLTAGTVYIYRVRAFGAAAADTSAWTATVPATTGTVSFTMVGAGEISTGLSTAGPLATAHIVDSILTADAQAFAFTIGNNLTDATANSTFPNSQFDKTWGVGGTFSARTYYALGNGDFDGGRGAAGVYSYFGARTGAASKGWFSFDKGSWHIVVLNSSDWEHGKGPTFGTQFDAASNSMILVPSEQVDWLTTDLAAARQAGAKCIAVISWERRLYTSGSGTLERQANMRPMGSIMLQNKVDLLISAKDKLYERFAPANLIDATADPNGVRQFIVGTGGRSSDALPAGTIALREAAFDGQWGVLKLTLGDGNYSWQFINTNPAGPTDKSDAPVPCH